MAFLRKIQVDSIHLWTKCMQEKKKKEIFIDVAILVYTFQNSIKKGHLREDSLS